MEETNMLPTNNAESDVKTELQQITSEEPVNPDTPSSADYSLKTLMELMKRARAMISIISEEWNQTKSEYGITDDQMKKVLEYNEKVRKPRKETQPVKSNEESDSDSSTKTEEKTEEEYDEFNGLNLITPEKVVEIFGESSQIIGVDNTQTIDRIKSATRICFMLYSARSEYKEFEAEYKQILEEQESLTIASLEQIIKDETASPEDRNRAQVSLDMFMDNKYLRFIPKSIKNDPKIITYLVKLFHDQAKIGYILERARDYLKKLNVPDIFILQISQLEKRFLPEKYQGQNNILLLYFSNMIVHSKILSNVSNRRQVEAFIFTIDKFIRNDLKPEDREQIMSSIIEFEDIFIPLIPNKTSQVKPDEQEAVV